MKLKMALNTWQALGKSVRIYKIPVQFNLGCAGACH